MIFSISSGGQPWKVLERERVREAGREVEVAQVREAGRDLPPEALDQRPSSRACRR